MNKKGQALVEFIIILPIFLVLVLGVIDLGNIFYQKTMLEGKMNDVISMYESGNSSLEILEDMDLKNTTLDITEDDRTIRIHLKKEIDLITPGLNLVLDNPYQLDVSRSIPYE